MIAATSNWIAANANPKKKPIFLIEIEGYNRAFTTAPGMGSVRGIPSNPVIQFGDLITDFGGFTSFPGDVTLSKATTAGNLLFAFMYHGDGGVSISISDTAANTWTLLFSSSTVSIWWATAVSAPAGNIVTFVTGATRSNSEFYVCEIPPAYSGFAFGHASGSPGGTIATVTVGGNTLSVPNIDPLSSWQLYGLALAPAVGAAMEVNLGFLVATYTPTIDQFIAGGAAAQIAIGGQTTAYDWIVGIDDISLTVSDLDGGADLSDFTFNVQDRAQAITGDMASFVFEGKKCYLKQGFGTIDGYSNRVVFDPTFALIDYLTLFSGKIDSVASDNNNDEYKFTVPDIRKDLSKIIYQTADDGFPTDSNHRKTISANPLDILLDILENQVGYSTSQIDVAGITNYRDTIFAGEEFVFSLDSPPAAKDFIENEILKPLGGYHWTDSLGVIRVKFFYPLAPTSVATLDHTNLLNVPIASQAGLVTEVTYRFDATTDGKFMSESVQDWGPGIAKYGLFGEQVIESVGLRSGFQGYFMAQFISRLIFLRYGDKQLEIDGLQTIWSHCRLEPGDIISLTSSKVPDRIAGTMGVTAQAFEVLDRSWSPLAGRVTFRVLEIDLSKFKQYLITPNAEADFAADTAPNQAKYMYLCNAAGKYSTGAPGNTLC